MSNDTNPAINERIKILMKHYDLSQAGLAAAIGTTKQAVFNVAAGKNQPGYVFLSAIAHRFPELNCRWLLTGEGSLAEGLLQRAKQENCEKELEYLQELVQLYRRLLDKPAEVGSGSKGKKPG